MAEPHRLLRHDPIHDIYREAFAQERAALADRVEQVRAALKDGDLGLLRELGPLVLEQRRRGDDRTGGNLERRTADLDQAFSDAYDEAFPLPPDADLRTVLDTPWPTASRDAALRALLGCSIWVTPQLDDVADAFIAAGDAAAMRVLVLTPLGRVTRPAVTRLLDALHAHDALDAPLIEHAFTVDRWLGNTIVGRDPSGGPPPSPAACADAVRPYVDAMLWRMTAAGVPDHELPQVIVPRGLRFVLRALDWTGEDRTGQRLGAAELSDAERAQLAAHLAGQPLEVQLRAFALRRPAGDAEALLPVLGLAPAVALLRLIDEIEAAGVARHDRAQILAAAATAGPDVTAKLLKLTPSELVSAALGGNRAAVLKRVKNNALAGIAAYGMLPLAEGETVPDRYTTLREVAKRGPKLGPNRRHSHAAAVEVALEHLAQVAGLPDASRLETECEIQLAEATPPPWTCGDYTVAVVMDGPDPVIAVSSSAKPLKTVPAAVRADARYTASREYQDLLRDQARRLRTGVIERLVATGAPVTPDELAGLRRLPAGASMLPALLWRDRNGAVGLLDDVDPTGPVNAVHPYDLYDTAQLAHWQAEVVRRRLRQPVKQAFRELYVLTPAEREAVDASQRFAGHTVTGRVAGQLLSGRGWRTHDDYADHQATRPAGKLTAALSCDFHGYFGMGDVEIGALRFLSGRDTVPLADVPPVVFSEVMRDLDLVVSVAGTGPARFDSPARAQSRAEVLAALIDDLGLRRVTVEGTTAVVRGSRAVYRVHLTSGSIHVEPGGYLCVVPAGFGGKPHRRLFLPFADDDPMTSVVLSKVLLLAEDEKITDPSILAQLAVLAAR
ncbi:hypothetical protein Cme02nite_07930 [Catellatospora methionotrophica]|uniref:DUF4132 domain-containing protein n=1 Tax=Catellatospora methionotrophica TaxID=121620 RepID=A0A8J3PES3_9ACTN|nr:DUF4132 domain-containing protein [Catellatospora methionotrophica]GIG12461.1 hypothetical protein Cme02nite_07930 [Catellatospora methionotrophica]